MIFANYKVILLDASFFFSEFSETVKEGLKSKSVYVADSLTSEIEQYRNLLSDSKKIVYEKNVQFLNEQVNVISPDFSTFGDQAKNLNGDIWGLIQLIIQINNRFVVVTANQLLIQKIIACGLQIDIYDLFSDSFIQYSYENSRSLNYGIGDLSEQIPILNTPFKSGDAVYQRDGIRLLLGEEIRSGREGTLFKISDHSELIAKVFHKDCLPKEKYRTIERLKGINETIDVDWVEFPLEILFRDTDCQYPIGFIQKYIPTGKNLDENALFIGDLLNIPDRDLATRQSEIVRLCAQIVCQVCYLNIHGFYVSDFNMGNFAENVHNNSTIQMWDTDSFGYGSYFGNLFDAEFVESNSHTPYDTNTKAGIIDICNEALYQFIFTLFSLGDAPISSYTKKFKYDKPKYDNQFRKELFPETIWEHMEAVFRGERKPSAEELLRQLIRAKDDIFNTDKTYSELLIDLIPEFVDYRKQVTTHRHQQIVKSVLDEYYNKTNAGESLSGSTSTGKTSGSTSTGKTSGSTSTGKTSGGTSTGKSSGEKRPLRNKVRDIIVLLLIAGFVFVWWYSEYYIPHHVEEVEKAGLYTGKSVGEIALDNYAGWEVGLATLFFEAHGADVETVYQYSSTTKKDTVIEISHDEENNTVTLYVSNGLEEDNSFEEQAVVDVSQTELVLNREDSTELTISASGSLPERYLFSVVRYTGIDFEWGDWLTDSSVTAVIKGSEGSSGYVRVYIESADTEEPIGYTDIYVQIAE